MARSAQHTVLITLFEGRYFVRRPGSKVYVQCRFNDEILTTDPVDHTPKPIWDTELAWDIDTKILGFLRSQRVRLKLICYTIDTQNRREPLGYVMLDLRTAEADLPAQEKWYQLVNSKQNGAFKPEIKLGFAVAPKGSDEARDFGASAASGKENTTNDGGQKGAKLGRTSTGSEVRDSRLQSTAKPSTAWTSISTLPIELMEGGFYQVGTGQDQWLFCITIAFAENLSVLTQRPDQKSHEDSEYYFYYTLMGNDISSERFSNISEPTFSSQRVSIRIRASVANLQQFLRDLGKIIIYLCCNSQVLGFADIPLTDLIWDEPADAVVVEKVYSMYNPKQELPVSVDGKSPSVGLSMAVTPEGRTAENVAADRSKTQAKGGPSSEKTAGVEATQSAGKWMEPIIPEKVAEAAVSYQSLTERKEADIPAPNLINYTSAAQHFGDHHRSEEGTSIRWHQYRFAVDLRSVRDFHPKAASIYFRYSYPPFGTSSPIITHPPLDILRTPHEVLLPHSFCAFEFVMGTDRLRTYLEAVPLVIEMWGKSPFSKDVLMGTVTIDLSRVLGMPRVMEETGAWLVQSLDEYVVVSSVGGEDGRIRKVADLRVVFALEDFGMVEEQDEDNVMDAHQQPEWRTAVSEHHQPRSKRPSVLYQSSEPELPAESPSSAADTPRSVAPSIHETPEYRVALQLELWKQEEERKFKEHLRNRENELMTRFSNEWKRREKEREAMMRRKIGEFRSLEGQMQRLVVDLEGREKKLVKGEEDLIRRKEELEREGARRVEEARDAARRLHDEFRHRMKIEKGKVAEAESARDGALKERDEIETKRQALETEVHRLRKEITSGNEAGLKAEVNQLVGEKMKLEKKVAGLEKSKRHYKSEWVNALRSLARAKKGWQMDLEERLEREREEVERWRVKVRGREELVGVEGEKRVLEDLRRELEMLKGGEGDGRGRGKDGGGGGMRLEDVGVVEGGGGDVDWWTSLLAGLKGSGPAVGRESFAPEVLKEVERLAKEREALIESGLYTRDDSLVRELDKRIRELLAARFEE
ncbi:hypothetical protein HDV00_007869 [Rhizophlyctis rosea]|nr:hypothetical protein HDV00_007869 [Rhizophlyctis rosea]